MPETFWDGTLEHDGDGEANAGIVRVVHVIAAVDVIDVEVVGVVPAIRPRINETKPIAAVLEARISADHNWGADVEVVLTAKVGAETLVGNAAAAPLTEAEFRLCVLPGRGFLRALGSAMGRDGLELLMLLFVGLGLLLMFLF